MKFCIGDIVSFKTTDGKIPDYTYQEVQTFEKKYKKGYNISGVTVFKKNEAEVVEIVNNKYFCTYTDVGNSKVTLSFNSEDLKMLMPNKPIDLKEIDEILNLL